MDQSPSVTLSPVSTPMSSISKPTVSNSSKNSLYLLIFGCVCVLSLAIVGAAWIMRPQDSQRPPQNGQNQQNGIAVGEPTPGRNEGNTTPTPRPTLPAGWTYKKPTDLSLNIATPALSDDIKALEPNGFLKWLSVEESGQFSPLNAFGTNVKTYIVAYHAAENNKQNDATRYEFGGGLYTDYGSGFWIHYTKNEVMNESLDSLYQKMETYWKSGKANTGVNPVFSKVGEEIMFGQKGLRFKITDSSPNATGEGYPKNYNAVLFYYKNRVIFVETVEQTSENKDFSSAVVDKINQIKQLTYFD